MIELTYQMVFKVFIVFTYLSFFLSGVNRDTAFISVIFSFLACTLGLIHIVKENNHIIFPKNYFLIVIFLGILNIYLFFVEDKVNPFVFTATMFEGIVYWLIFFNLKNSGKSIKKIIITLTLIYSAIFIYSKLFNTGLVNLAGLLFDEGTGARHWTIGNLWLIAILLVLGNTWRIKSIKSGLFIFIGTIFIALSNIRSTYLALTLGIIYLLAKNVTKLPHKKIIASSVIAVMVCAFIIVSFNKTTFFDRPYFIQSLSYFLSHPLGIGVGNFDKVAEVYHFANPDGGGVSIYTHNLYLETLSGVGIFSILFLIFLIKVTIDILKNGKKHPQWGASIIALLTIFMIDTSYTIPGFIFLMFMLLSQSSE